MRPSFIIQEGHADLYGDANEEMPPPRNDPPVEEPISNMEEGYYDSYREVDVTSVARGDLEPVPRMGY